MRYSLVMLLRLEGEVFVVVQVPKYLAGRLRSLNSLLVVWGREGGGITHRKDAILSSYATVS